MQPYSSALLFTLFNIANAITSNVTVAKLGIAVGKLEESKWSGRKFYSFKGIPFAKAPIGNLRYAVREYQPKPYRLEVFKRCKKLVYLSWEINQPPEAVDSWKDNRLDATNYRNICPQTKQPGYDVEGYDEDCLHLNVYVPADAREPLPVMVWIHGGYFMGGHAQRFKPHYLMESDVILVVPQFRLGVLGLLCLETEEVPGNVQFLDQIMAMKWVRDNIECFGGARNRVTLFGQSSGAFSVNLHLLSPLSRGLFHRTIIQSNSIYTPGMIDRNPVENGKEIARVLGCDTETVESTTQCMKKLPARSILEGFDKYVAENSANGSDSRGGNRPVVQKRSGSKKFITEEPSVSIEKGEYLKLPMMGGATSQDGSLLTSGLYDGLSTTKLLEDEDFLKYELVPLALKKIAIADETGAVSQILTEKYFPNGEIGDFSKMAPGLTDIGSVLVFKAGIYRMMRENSRFQPTYLYSFDYRGSRTRFGYETGKDYPFDGGVAHSDDNIYLFPFPDELTSRDTAVAKNMVKLWTSFAINGTPAGEDWPKMYTRKGPYFKIDYETKIGENYIDEYTATIRKESSGAESIFHDWLELVLKTISMLFVE